MMRWWAILCIWSIGAGALAAAEPNATSAPPHAPQPWVEFSEVRLLADVSYRQVGGDELRLDFYRPRGVAMDQPLPAVILIHGGAWRTGDKRAIAPYAHDVVAAGFAAVAVQYRLAPEHRYPAAVHDVAAAVEYVHQQAANYAIDPDRLAVWGYSAGAHLACMLATMADEPPELCQEVLGSAAAPSLCCVVAGGAPCELRTIPEQTSVVAHFLGGTRLERPEIYAEASPASHASPGDRPILFYHGTRDLMVPIAMARGLYDQHCALGIPSQFCALPGQGHMLTFLLPEGRQAAIDFLRAHLAP
jgi:triacylglycerol lipase